jgi:hypothetical protein
MRGREYLLPAPISLYSYAAVFDDHLGLARQELLLLFRFGGVRERADECLLEFGIFRSVQPAQYLLRVLLLRIDISDASKDYFAFEHFPWLSFQAFDERRILCDEEVYLCVDFSVSARLRCRVILLTWSWSFACL